MKTPTLLIAAFAVIAPITARANLYQGTIALTVTQTTDPWFPINSVFSGWYSYESQTVDGVFNNWADPRFLTGPNPSKLYTMGGNVSWPVGISPGFGYPTGSGTNQSNYIAVSGGEVTSLSFFTQYGPYFVSGQGLQWEFYYPYYQGAPGWTRASGTMTFSAPHPAADSGPTLALLGCSLLGVFRVRRLTRFRQSSRCQRR